jgi:hypothetical protein
MRVSSNCKPLTFPKILGEGCQWLTIVGFLLTKPKSLKVQIPGDETFMKGGKRVRVEIQKTSYDNLTIIITIVLH